ncbi:hypothetical protein AAC978_15380 [Desulfitobacterium sp. THU1]|uniref:hypothetical protein n=1 Tax=Desulfitobacterium sp. THU1 TaxID=3138072 RepID=UPI00311F21DD
MKRFIMLFILLILAVSLCACSQKESSTPPNASESSSSVAMKSDGQKDTPSAQSENEQERKMSIEISPPDGWKLMEGSVLPVHHMKNTASFMVKEEPFTSGTLDGVVDEALEIYKKSFDNLAVQGEVETITIDGKEAKKLTFTCVVSKMNMKYLYVYLFAEGKTYVITFGDLADSFDSLSADYTAILSNIEFKAL